MAAINDLISLIQDETLRNRIQEEVSKMAKQKKFGLVFEEHMPESTPLYDMPIKRGCNVIRRDSKDDKSIYVVLKVEGDTAVCVKSEQKDEAVTFELKDIVRVAEFGESIYRKLLIYCDMMARHIVTMAHPGMESGYIQSLENWYHKKKFPKETCIRNYMVILVGIHSCMIF